jgi:hypothetical protein
MLHTRVSSWSGPGCCHCDCVSPHERVFTRKVYLSIVELCCLLIGIKATALVCIAPYQHFRRIQWLLTTSKTQYHEAGSH